MSPTSCHCSTPRRYYRILLIVAAIAHACSAQAVYQWEEKQSALRIPHLHVSPRVQWGPVVPVVFRVSYQPVAV